MPVAVRPPRPTVQTVRFESSLATRSQPTFLAQLVHERSGAHLSGVIEGIAFLVAPAVATHAPNPVPVATARRVGIVRRFANRWNGVFGTSADETATRPDAGPPLSPPWAPLHLTRDVTSR